MTPREPSPPVVPPRLRVLLTGCHGRLGQHLLRVLLEEAEVLGLGLEEQSFVLHPAFHYARLEGVSRTELRTHFRAFRPHAVLNAAAWTQVDLAEREKEACWRANVDLVRGLLDCCRPHGTWLGQVSTDYVFDGQAGPYGPEDLPAPRGVYAQSKLAAENLIRGSEVPAAIFRTLVLFGKGHGLAPDFFEWVLRELGAGRGIRVVTDQVGNCCWAMDLARAMKRALLARRVGLFHVAARGRMSRHGMAQLVARLAGLDASLVEEAGTAGLGQAAPRPLQSGLHTEATERELGMALPTIEEALRAWLQDRPEMWCIN